MVLQISVDVRNARLDVIGTVIGFNPVLELRSGAVPENCEAQDSGILLARAALPLFMMAAANGSKEKLGAWVLTGIAEGKINHFRLRSSTGACKMQGDVTLVGGGGAMEVDATLIAVDQPVTVNKFKLKDANA